MITERSDILKHRLGEAHSFTDSIAIEEPLEIRLEWEVTIDPLAGAGADMGATASSLARASLYPHADLSSKLQAKSVAITMRTPRSDRELALGFLFTEGLIENPSDVIHATPCGPRHPTHGTQNIIKVRLASRPEIISKIEKLNRNFYTTSSCGVCGKSSIAALMTQNSNLTILSTVAGPSIEAQTLSALPDRLRRAQETFDRTGGLHAAAFFDSLGNLLSTFEDVGRHNALDKLIGREFLICAAGESVAVSLKILMLSGRISFELVQKAAMAGVRMIAAIGAPSSLAIELAEEFKITLVGFMRGSSFNVYTEAWRIR